MKKAISTFLIIAIIIAGVTPSTAEAKSGTWKSDAGGWWYEYSDGTYPAGQWAEIDGYWYYFLGNGYMDYSEYRDGCWLNSDGSWNTAYSGGHWASDSYGWWYTDNSGWYPTSTWLWIDGYCYYFRPSGYMAFDEWVDGCYVDKNGAWVPNYNNQKGSSYGSYTFAKEVAASCDGIDFVKAYSTSSNETMPDISEYSKDGRNVYRCRFYTSKEVNSQYLYIKYNGDEGYRDLNYDLYAGYDQYIPDYSNPTVYSSIHCKQYGRDDVVQGSMFASHTGSRLDDEHYFETQENEDQARYDYMIGQGYKNYIDITIRFFVNGPQSFDLYYKNNKLITVKCDNNFNLSSFDKGKAIYDWQLAKDVTSDVSKYKANMSDLELIEASKYWFANHSYYDYTCYACHRVENIMKLKGYPTWSLRCGIKYVDGQGENDYSYNISNSIKNKGVVSGGHHFSMIRVSKDKVCIVEVQGRDDLEKGQTDFSKPWEPAEAKTISVYDDLHNVGSHALKGYNTVYEMMKGDYGIDITKYDPFDCTTWY